MMHARKIDYGTFRLQPVPRLEADSDGLARGPRIFANVAIALAAFMAVLDGTIANVALPTISHELSIDAATSVWIVNAFQIAICIALLPLSALGDLIGYRRIYLPGIVIFTIGSLACAVSHSLPLLVAARVLQGFGAAGIVSVGPALYRAIYPSKLLGRGLATNALIIATGSAAGPTLGGMILAVAPWPWIFAINVPIGIAAIVLVLLAIPWTPRRPERLDIPSSVASATAFGGIILGLDVAARGLAAAVSVPLLAVGCGAAVVFIRRQGNIANPLIPLSLFANRRFSLAIATSLTAFVAQGLAFVALPFQLTEALHATPLVAGLLLSAWPLAIMWTAPLAGKLSDRYSAAVLSTTGLSVLAIGLTFLVSIHTGSSPLVVIVGNIVCGLGFGFFQAPNNREMLCSVPRERAGNASGMLAMMRILGQTLGAALVALYLGQAAFLVGTEAHVPLELPLRGTLLLSGVLAWTAAFISSTRLVLPPTTAVRRIESGTQTHDAAHLKVVR